MKRIQWIIGILAASVLLLGAKMLGSAETDRYETIIVERRDIEATVSAIGTLKPRYQVEVGARVSGQIDRLHVKAGDVVKKGQLLAELDPRIPQAAVDAGRAELANLKAKLIEQQAQLELSEQKYLRQKNLIEIDATSRESVDIASAEYKTAIARIEQLKAQIAQTQSRLSGDEAQLDYTRIYAPIAGTVISLSAEEGQTLNSTYQTPTILHIADLSSMTIWSDVSEADIRKIKVDMPVYFTTLGGEGRRWVSKVAQVLPAPPIARGKEEGTALAPSTRKVILYTALFDVDNTDGALMPSMTAQVSFVTSAARDVPVVPLPALTAVADKPGYFQARIVDQNGAVEERELRIGVRTRLSAEVLSGLSSGERLIVAERVGDEGPRRIQW